MYKKACFVIAFFVCAMAADSRLIQREQIQNPLLLDVDFLTDKEYGKYLYQNPRGVSCKACHGEYGEGMILATYTHRGEKREIHAPDITQLELQDFSKGIQKARGVMPKYYLTDSEIQAIYSYLKQ